MPRKRNRPRDGRRSPRGPSPYELLLAAILVLDKLGDLYRQMGHS